MANTVRRYDNSGTVTVGRLVGQSFDRTGDGAFVRFEGRTKPVGFRGEGLSNRWSYEAVFASDEHADYVALRNLFEAAFAAADARLRVHMDLPAGSTAEADQVVEVHSWQVAREGGGVLRLSFEAQEVDG